MIYIIDSDWLIDLLANDPAAASVLGQVIADGAGMSVVSYAEIYQGTLRGADPGLAQANLAMVTALVPVLPFDMAVARRLAVVRESLMRQQRRVRSRALDLMIAATAIEHGLTLVTRNRSDYADIPGLRLY